MKKRNLLSALAMSAVLALGSGAFAYSGQEFSKAAKLTLEDARAIALKAYPGKVTDEELEKFKGGLRYTFDIKSGSKTKEVSVDGNSGKILGATTDAGEAN
jgi:uncharacterized membrane protein YkoI